VSSYFQEYSIRNMKLEHLHDIVKMCDTELGENYVKPQNIVEALKDDNYLIKVARVDDELVGFCYSVITSGDKLFETIAVRKTDIPFTVNTCSMVSVIKVVVVKNTFQRNGIGSMMIHDIVSRMSNMGVKAFACVAWKNGQTSEVNLEKILVMNKFTKRGEIPNFWRVRSIRDDFHCHTCGSSLCNCSAALYFRRV